MSKVITRDEAIKKRSQEQFQQALDGDKPDQVRSMSGNMKAQEILNKKQQCLEEMEKYRETYDAVFGKVVRTCLDDLIKMMRVDIGNSIRRVKDAETLKEYRDKGEGI